ncbi:hypothetical protein D3C75_1075090 [compost metagenome]
MKGQPEQRPKALAVSLQPDLFHSITWYACKNKMSARALLAHLAQSYVAAMEQAEQAEKGSDQGR